MLFPAYRGPEIRLLDLLPCYTHDEPWPPLYSGRYPFLSMGEVGLTDEQLNLLYECISNERVGLVSVSLGVPERPMN